jgi:hypothetical protein
MRPLSLSKILLLLILASGLLLGTFALVHAADATTGTELIVPIGGKTVSGPAEYIKRIFIYLIGFAALIAVFQLIFGAVEYTASAGIPALQESAKGRMRSAVIGLALLILSATILVTIRGGTALGLRDPKAPISDLEKQDRKETLAQLKKDLADMEANLIRAKSGLLAREKASEELLAIFDKGIRRISENIVANLAEKKRNFDIYSDPKSSEEARAEAGEAIAKALTKEQKLNDSLANLKEAVVNEQETAQYNYDRYKETIERTEYGIEKTKELIAAAEKNLL